MIKVKYILVFVPITLFFYASILFAEPLSPVTKKCVLQAAKFYNIPLTILIAMMSAENGRVGKYNINSNNTRDIGPMQINSATLRDWQKRGLCNYTEEEIKNNGCKNVFFAAKKLRSHLDDRQYKWCGVGDYHSQTLCFNIRYQHHVFDHLLKIKTPQDAIDIINKANSSIKKSY